MSRERSIDLERSPSGELPDDYLLVHVYKDVSLDLWMVRIRARTDVFTARPRRRSIRDMRSAVQYAKRVLNQLHLTGPVHWKVGEGPVLSQPL